MPIVGNKQPDFKGIGFSTKAYIFHVLVFDGSSLSYLI